MMLLKKSWAKLPILLIMLASVIRCGPSQQSSELQYTTFSRDTLVGSLFGLSVIASYAKQERFSINYPKGDRIKICIELYNTDVLSDLRERIHLAFAADATLAISMWLHQWHHTKTGWYEFVYRNTCNHTAYSDFEFAFRARSLSAPGLGGTGVVRWSNQTNPFKLTSFTLNKPAHASIRTGDIYRDLLTDLGIASRDSSSSLNQTLQFSEVQQLLRTTRNMVDGVRRTIDNFRQGATTWRNLNEVAANAAAILQEEFAKANFRAPQTFVNQPRGWFHDFLHEVGHSFGLDHAHESGSQGALTNGITRESVMAYQTPTRYNRAPMYLTRDDLQAIRPMMQAVFEDFSITVR